MVLLAPQKGQDVLNAYWSKLGKAQRLFARFTVPDPQEGRNITYDCWLEKPQKLRMVAGQIEILSDGKIVTIRDLRGKIKQKLKASPDDVPPMFEPFFGQHRWISPNRQPWFGKSALVLGPSLTAPRSIQVFLDPATALPLGTAFLIDGKVYQGECKLLKLDPPKAGFPRF